MRPLIGILLETFPKASETFILNEIIELERQGLDLHIFSLRHPSVHHAHPRAAEVKASVTYVPSLLPEFERVQEKELIDAHLTLFEQDSSAYLETLGRYLKRDDNQRLNEFLQGGYLARKLQSLGIIHLHAHFVGVPTATAEIAQAFSGISYSIAAHAKDIYLSDRNILNHRMAKAEFVFTCSEHNRSYLEEISTSSTPIHVAYHGVDTVRFSPIPKLRQSEVPLILSIGDLCEDEGFSYLIEACHLLKQIKMPFHCKIVGDGPLESALRRHISRLELNYEITLVSQLSQDQLIEYYQQADLFVLSSLLADDDSRDEIPSVLLEAMAMEIPVISTGILGISELMQSYYNGILVPEKDALALARALELLMRQSEFSQTLGKTGRLTVLDKFGLISNVGGIKESLLRAIKQPMRLHIQADALSDLLKLAAS